MPTLVQCLIDADPARLEAMAGLWGLTDLPRRRAEAAARLAERMLAPAGLAEARAALPADAQAALDALLAADGQVPWASFARRWGGVRAMGPGRMARERPWEAPASPAEALWYRGLLFRAFVEGPTGLIEVALIPSELRERLPAPPAPSFDLRPVEPPPAVLPAGDTLLDDACTLLAYLQNHPVRPSAKGDWPARDEARLAGQLRDPHPDRLALLRHLVERLGWLRADRSGCLRPRPEPVAAWLQAPAAEQRAALARAWLDSPAWNDLWHVPTLQPDRTGSWRNEPVIARRAIVHHLSACRSGEWYSLAGFAARIRESDPDFQRPDGDYANWYIRDAASGEFLKGFESWDAVEGALIRYLLTGPLAWLGLVDLGAEGQPGFWRASAFRLSAAGTAFLGLGEATPETPPPLTVRPDGTVLAPAARRYERFQLSRIADWERTGDPYIYRLTPASLERGRQQKIAPERVVAFLEQAAGAPLPRALATALGRCASHGPQARLERGLLLRVPDEELLKQIAAAPTTRRFIREMLGPTAALVAPADWPRLAQALVEQGLLPDVTGEER